MFNQKDFGKRLREFRKRKNLTPFLREKSYTQRSFRIYPALIRQ